MSGLLEKKWYVIKTVTGQENKIKNYVETESARLGYADYAMVKKLPKTECICLAM